MKKVVKKSLAIFMSLAMVLGAVVISNPATVQAADSYNAYLMFADGDWLWDNWNNTVANTSVTADGTYTVTLNASDAADKNTDAASGTAVFCVDIVGINNADISLDDIHIYTDGTEISVDTTKILTGDIEGNGNYRIEIYNMYGSGTQSDSPIDQDAITWSESLAVTFTISNTGLTSEDDASEEVTYESYNAYLMFADGDWLWDNWDSTVANTSVTGDGTYTVTLNASDAADKNTDAASGAAVFCVDIVGINSTEISLDDIHIYLDSEEIDVDVAKVLTGDIEENGNYRIEIYNLYGSGTASDSPIDTSSFTWSESLSVTFTISNVPLVEVSSEDTDDDTDDTDDTDTDSDTDADNDSAADTDEVTEDVTVEVNEGVSYNTSCVINLDADENMRSITITLSPLNYNNYDVTSWNNNTAAWIYVKDGSTQTVYGIASTAGASYTVTGTTTDGYTFEEVPITYFMYGDSIEITIPLSGEAATIEIGTGSWESAPDDAFIMVDQYVLSSTVVDTDTDEADSDDDTDSNTDSDNDADSDSDSDTTSTSNTKTTSDAAPYASMLVLLAGAAMVVIFRKRMA